MMATGSGDATAKGFAERLPVAHRHDVVQYRIDGGREKVKTP